MRRLCLLAVLLSVLLSGLPAGAADARRPSPRLKAFTSCDSLVAYARHHALRTVGPRRLWTPPMAVGQPGMAEGGTTTGGTTTGGTTTGGQQTAASGPQATRGDDFSGSNVQESGVDEPDVVKSDGRRLFTVVDGRLRAIDLRSAPPRALGSLPLDERAFNHQLLLRGDRALVISSTYDPESPFPATTLTEVAVGDAAALRVVRTMSVEGAFVSARLTGGTARIVLSSMPEFEVQPTRATIRRAGVGRWVPTAVTEDRRSGRRAQRRLVGCRAVRRPRLFSGVGMLTVLTLDLDRGLAVTDSDAVMTDAETVYASTRRLYVATPRWLDTIVPADGDPPDGTTTTVHEFAAADAGETRYRASGRVRGHVLNQFSLSEHRGHLRVATTDLPLWWNGAQSRESESFVTVLTERDGRLAQVGRVGGLGRGERIFAVRFVDDVGFVVTFRQTDPLYTVDLSTPARPRVLGELKVLGYSAYLHPVGNDRLLGVGQDATEEGQTQGTQVSLFDVSDLRNPVRLDQRAITDSFSLVEQDHLAFLWWPPSRLAVVPVQRYGEEQFAGAMAYRVVDGRRLEDAGRVSHASGSDAAPVLRSVVAGDRLFTVSQRGVRASRLDTLADAGWVPFE